MRGGETATPLGGPLAMSVFDKCLGRFKSLTAGATHASEAEFLKNNLTVMFSCSHEIGLARSSPKSSSCTPHGI